MADPKAELSAKRTPPRLTEVRSVEPLTPQMLRVVVGGEDLAGFGAGPFTDHYVKLQIPPAGAPYSAPFDLDEIKATLPRDQWPRVRTYSVRDWDPDRLELTIDFVNHGSAGVAGPWAASARPGDRLQMIGPGGAYEPDPDADWHLMAGDACVIPAIAVALERIPVRVPVHVIVSIDGPEEEHLLETPGELELTWIHRDSAVEQAAEPLLAAVQNLRFPPGRPHAFVHGEAGAVRAVRKHLLGERGIPLEDLSASGYWKRRRTEEGWREDKAEWKRQVEEDLRSDTER
jgi:NADPH-dependent ferric siderophore reductase